MSNKPLISIITGYYNRDRYVTDSIMSLINQDYENFEIIIFDDCSTDNTYVKLMELKKNESRITLIKHRQNIGFTRGLINSIQLAKGEYIAIHGSGDISYPDRLTKQVNFLFNNPDYVLVGANARVTDKDGIFIYDTNMVIENEQIKKLLPYKNPFIHSSIFFKKNTYFKAGGYPAYMKISQDLVMYNRLAEYGKFANIKDILVLTRIIPSSSSIKSRKFTKQLKQIIYHAVINRTISDAEEKYLSPKRKILKPNEILSYYHLLVSKKYLFHTKNIVLTRKHCIASLTNRFNVQAIFVYLFSYLTKHTSNCCKKF